MIFFMLDSSLKSVFSDAGKIDMNSSFAPISSNDIDACDQGQGK